MGKILSRDPRIEKDCDLYHSSVNSDDIGGVTNFPYFASTDTIKTINNSAQFEVFSSQGFLNYYLKDIKVSKNRSNIESIEGKLLFHRFSTQGETIHYELYIAKFAKVGNCFLPKTIKFFPIDDFEHRVPRIISEINYKLKE